MYNYFKMGKGYGVAASISIAFISYGLSLLNPLYDPLVLGIILGTIFSNLIRKPALPAHGADYSIKIFLPVGIALYGFRLKVAGNLPAYEIAGVLIVLVIIFSLSMLISRLFKLNNNTAILLSSGLAVCGASAITVISPAIRAERHETSITILAIMSAGLLCTIFYPVLGDMLRLSPDAYAFLSGSTLPMVGLVKVSASHFGSGTVEHALALKSIRIFSLILIIPAVVILSGISDKRFKMPWFMILFIFFAVAANIYKIPEELEKIVSLTSSLFLTITLSAIGLRTSIDSMGDAGFSPFVAALAGTAAILLILYVTAVQNNLKSQNPSL